MQIKYINSTLKLDSSLITSLFTDNLLSLTVTGNINCCKTNNILTEFTKVINLVPAKKWVIDFSVPVNLGSNILSLNFYNTVSGNTYNTITGSPISLATILGNCASEICTMESVGGYNTIFKTLIDNWFISNAITSNVTVTVTGNVVFVSNLPINFIPTTVTYGATLDPDILTVTFITALNKEVYLAGNSVFLNSKFFELDSFTDGVYKVQVVALYLDGSKTTESNCIFVDILTKCMVASWLNDLLAESSKKDSEPVATMIHLLHYALVTGSNCGCNCDSLCQAYKELVCLLNGSKTTSDCGC